MANVVVKNHQVQLVAVAAVAVVGRVVHVNRAANVVDSLVLHVVHGVEQMAVVVVDLKVYFTQVAVVTVYVKVIMPELIMLGQISGQVIDLVGCKLKSF